MIDAEKSDLFDVLAYIAFALAPITRDERANTRETEIFPRYDGQASGFLDFVLFQYVRQGVEELERGEASSTLFNSNTTPSPMRRSESAGVPVIRDTFIEFQQYLYD